MHILTKILISNFARFNIYHFIVWLHILWNDYPSTPSPLATTDLFSVYTPLSLTATRENASFTEAIRKAPWFGNMNHWTEKVRTWIHDQAQPIGNYETARKLFTKLWALTLKNLNDSESLFQL